jgi:F-type H+-transporting ATPase subunit gamma
MTERLADVEARIGTVHQLASVITAMRGIAAARSRDAQAHLPGIRAYAQVVGDAIGQALALAPEPSRANSREARADGHIVVALCAEQGFAGAFNDRILDAAGALLETGSRAHAEFLLVGDRGLVVAAERGLRVDWSTPMIVHAGQAEALAVRIVEAIYERLDAGSAARVTLVHAVPTQSAELQILERKLVPFDFDRFPAARGAIAPMLTLPPAVLLARLVEEYVFAELCEAVMQSFAAENAARTRAMIAARTHVADTLDTLVARSRQLRQEEITNEIVELAGGAAAAGV